MDSEADDLEALRNAALATLSNDNKPQTGEDEDLEALRRAALITRKQKQIQVLQHPVRVEEPPRPPVLFHRPTSNPVPPANLISLTPGIPVVRPMQYAPMPFPHRMPLLGMRPPPHLALRPPLLPLLMPPPRHRAGPMFRPNHSHPRMHRAKNTAVRHLNPKERPNPVSSNKPNNVPPNNVPKRTEETAAAETKTNDKFSRYDTDSSSDDEDEHLSSKKGEVEEDSEAESTISDTEDSSNQNSKVEKRESTENNAAQSENSETRKSPNIDPPDTPEIETPEPPITPKIFDEEADVLTIMDEDDILLAIDDFLEDKPVVLEPKKEPKKSAESQLKTKPNIKKVFAPTKNQTLTPKTQDSNISSSKPPTVVTVATSSTSNKQSVSKPPIEFPKPVKSASSHPQKKVNRNRVNEAPNDTMDKFVPQKMNRATQDVFTSSPPRQRRDSDLYSVGSSELSFLSSDSETEANDRTSDTENMERIDQRQEDFVEKSRRTSPKLHPERTKNLDLRKKLESRGLVKKNPKDKHENSGNKSRNNSPKPEIPLKKMKVSTKDYKKAKTTTVLNTQNTQSHVILKEKSKKLVRAPKIDFKHKNTSEFDKSEPKNDTTKIQNSGKTRSRNLISFESKNSNKTRPQDKRSQSPRDRSEKAMTQNKVTVKDRLGRRKRPGSKRDADFDQPTKKSTKVSDTVKPAQRDSTVKRIVLKQSSEDLEDGEIVDVKVPKLSSNTQRTTARFNFKNQTEDSLSEDFLSGEDEVPSSRIKINITDSDPRLDSDSEDENAIRRRDFTGIKRRVVINKSSPSSDDTQANKKKNVRDRLGRISKLDDIDRDYSDYSDLKHRTNDGEKRPRSSVKKLTRKPTVSIKKVPKNEVNLEEKIRKIKARNSRILLRQREIEQEKEKFG